MTQDQTMQTEAKPSIAELLKELEQAVHAHDKEKAAILRLKISQLILAETAECEAAEAQVSFLMRELERAQPALVPDDEFSLVGELGGTALNEADLFPVWFGTNRKPDSSGKGFTGERSGQITKGRVDVSIPDAHKFGELGSGWFKRLKRLDLRDDILRVEHIESLPDNLFFSGMQEIIDHWRELDRSPQAILFIHGYNVSFEQAALRTAQIGTDLKVFGPTAFFSWPSKGSAASYSTDEATIEASEKAIAEFIVDFTTNCGADKVHVIAHSMGNRGFLRALQRISADAESRTKVKFGQIILAAPDLDRDLFVDLAYLYPKYGEHCTLYASGTDFAVYVSARLHGAPRAGFFEPYTIVPGIETVCVPNFDLDLLFHSYFAQAQALLYDIGDLLRTNQPASDRQRLVPMSKDVKDLWRIKE